MLEADELTAALKKAGSRARRRAEGGRRRPQGAWPPSTPSCRRRSNGSPPSAPRSSPRSTRSVLAIFEQVARKRNGVAVAEARDGICTICHVRLRPQVFNTVLRNEPILQCDTATASSTSCRRRPPPRRRTRRPSRRRDRVTASTPAALRRRIRTGRRLHRRRRARQSRARPATASASSDADGTLVEEFAESIGVATNNVAEYRGAARGARVGARARPPPAARPIRFAAARAADARQLQGEARRACSRCTRKARLLAHEIGRVTFEHVGRAKNAHADRLANTAMDDARRKVDASTHVSRARIAPAMRPPRAVAPVRAEQVRDGWPCTGRRRWI